MMEVDKKLTEIIYLVENAKEYFGFHEYGDVLQYMERIREVSMEVTEDILTFLEKE